MLSLPAQIESVLVFKGEPMTVKELSGILKASESAVRDALGSLEDELSDRGVTLLTKGDEVALGTSPTMSETIERMRKEELEHDIGKAGLETLTIILYRGPVTRGMIDYIRGVNSTFIIRRLLVRGLIEKMPNPRDSRSVLYQPTFELLSFLGIKRVEDLPEYAEAQKELRTFEERKHETDSQ